MNPVETTVGRVIFNDICRPGMPFYNYDDDEEGAEPRSSRLPLQVLGREQTIRCSTT
jgi:hypothetical protein